MSSGEQKQSGAMGEISARLLQAHANDGIKRVKKTDNDDEANNNGDESMHVSNE